MEENNLDPPKNKRNQEMQLRWKKEIKRRRKTTHSDQKSEASWGKGAGVCLLAVQEIMTNSPAERDLKKKKI